MEAEIYTKEDWHRDRSFSATPGQEVEEEIYQRMYDILPILPLPVRRETVGYDSGFCVSEPASTDEKGRETFSAFAQKNGHFYYLGDFPQALETKFREIFRLRKMLRDAGIPYRYRNESVRVKSVSGENDFVREHYHITYPKDGITVVSAIEGDYSTGGEQDTIEIMGLPKEEEKESHPDFVIGNLKAKDVFERIKRHYIESRGESDE